MGVLAAYRKKVNRGVEVNLTLTSVLKVKYLTLLVVYSYSLRESCAGLVLLLPPAIHLLNTG
jgi:hypothetical protein